MSAHTLKLSHSVQIQNGLRIFSAGIVAMATEDENHKATIKALNAEYNRIVSDRQNEIDNGIPAEKVGVMFPLDSVSLRINAENRRHNSVKKTMNAELEKCYSIIPDSMYSAYCVKITTGKNGAFLAAVKDFLIDAGFTVNDTQVNRIASRISERMGVQMNTSKRIVSGENFTRSMSEKKFNKLFMASIRDVCALETTAR